jgi:hypothetical protein
MESLPMMTYFAWCRNGESFDLELHQGCDLEILELTIDHREGEVALATVVVSQLKLPPWEKRHVYISIEGNVLFSGRLVGLPIKISKDLISLELTSEPLDAEMQLQRLAAELKQHPFWDEAFVDFHEQDNPAEWLEARSALFAWDRSHGTVCISDLFQGRHTTDLTNVFFQDSLKVSLAETPLSKISVNLSVEWIQQGSGEVSLGSKIAAAFPGGMINTLTPKTLQATWPKEGQKLGKSGFWVVRSHLKGVTPPKTGILDIYPTLTPEFLTWDESTQSPKKQRAKRSWMQGRLTLGWQYWQKRKETVRFTLEQITQLDGTIRPLTRTLNLRLQEVANASESTFFLTHRGRQAVEHALEIARTHLAASARCLEIEITLPYEAGFDLSMDLSVRLVDPRIPGGEAVGKVVAYQFRQDGMKAQAWVRLAASVGGTVEQPLPSDPYYYVDPAYGDTAIPYHHQTSSGLLYANYSDQRPTTGILEIGDLSLHDILREVLVSHDAEKQIQSLHRQQYPVRQNLKHALEEIPTVVSLHLLSLKTKSVAEHTIHLTTIRPWTAPKQVNLRGD